MSKRDAGPVVPPARPIRPPACSMRIRPLAKADRADIERAFRLLSPETLYWRFGRTRIEPGEVLAWVAQLGGGAHFALGAYEPVSGALIGVARYAVAGGRLAEVAITVLDEWQGRGVGGALLGGLARAACNRGFRELQAFVLPGNRAAVQLLRGAGA